MSIGVVILAKSSTPELVERTRQTITTLIQAAPRTMLDIVVLEQQPNQQWPLTRTIYCPEPFHFNKFANRGCSLVCGDHLLVCNNDLIFTDNSVDILHQYSLDHHLPVVCPVCPLNDLQSGLSHTEIGTQIGKHFTGWCFLIQRKAYERIGGFDEDFSFWYADNAVVEQLKQQHFSIAIVPEANVIHLASSTLKTLRRPDRIRLTKQQTPLFISKYGQIDCSSD